MVNSVPKTVRSNLKLGTAKDGVKAIASLGKAAVTVASDVVRHTRKPKRTPTFIPLTDKGSLPVHPGPKPMDGTKEQNSEWNKKARGFSGELSSQRFAQNETSHGYSTDPKGFGLKPKDIGHQFFTNDESLSKLTVLGRRARSEGYGSTDEADVNRVHAEANRLTRAINSVKNRNLSAQQAAINKRLS